MNLKFPESPSPFFVSIRALFACVLTAAALIGPPAHALDLARTETRVDTAIAKYGVAGRGVIVAIFSRGIDWKNADFRNADGTTRIDYILDLSDDTGATAPGNTVGAGTLYTRAQINAALAASSNLNTRDAGGSGSALAGIAAGGGRNNTQFRGIAPEARLIIVKVTSDGSPAHDGEAAEASFYAGNTLVTSAMQFVTAKAAELKLPCVTMLDLGTLGGPMDGTGDIAQKIDRTVGPGIAGLAVVTSSTNEGSVANHASSTVTSGGTVTLDIVKVGSGTLRFEVWYPETDRFNVRIFTPSGVSGPYLAPAAPALKDGQSTADFSYFHLGRDTDFSNSTSARRQILIDFIGPAGSYKVELTGATVVSGRFDATLDSVPYAGPGVLTSRFLNLVTPGSVWDGGAAKYVICTNSYIGRKSYTDIDGISRTLYSQAVGELWLGSGVGPTQDGRYGIDVSAPGDSVFTTYAPKSYYATDRSAMIQGGGGLYGRQGGVGAANPLVTGIVALMLELNPTLDAAQIKQILQKSARSDSFTGTIPNNNWGYGKIDALAALDIAKTFGTAAKLPGVTVPLLIPAGATAVDTRAFAVHTNGGVLVAISGQYTVRPSGAGAQALVFPDYTNPQPYNLSYVVRLLANGQPDPAFTSAPGGDGTVNAVAVQSDGKILVGGTFASFNGVFFKNLARLQADGKSDATFTVGSGPDAQVNALAVQPDGKILVGGLFQNFGGQARPYLLRLSATGAVDTTFAPAVNGAVNSLVLQSDGKILIGGNFTTVGGATRTRIARLLATGAVDPTFDPGAGANGEVVTLIAQSDGAIVAAGEFTSFAGQSRTRIARLLATGALDSTFSPSAAANDTVISLALEASGNVLLGGAFTQVNGVTRNRIARLLPTGALDLTFDPGTGADNTVRAILPRADGTIFLGGLFDQYQGTAVNEVVAITGTPVATAFVQAPRAIIASPGGTARFVADATGPALSYQWFKEGVAIAGATSSALTLTNVAASAQGRYTLQVTSATGTVLSADATLTVAAGAAGQIVNLSVLTSLDAPGDTFTLGFVIGGTGTSGAKPLLVRAAGPQLAQFGVGNPLADPKLQFFAGPTLSGENDNWGGTSALSGLIAQVGAFPYTSNSSKDAAFAPANLTTAANSVVVSGVGNATGAVIAEVYDATLASANTAATPRLINVSVLKNIPSGATLTAGFVIGGITSKTVLIRAIGPTLGTFGVGGPLSDPKLTLNQSGVTDPIATNDNWGGSPALRDAMSAVGAFALDAASKDAALLITLAPGSYTAQANAVGALSGSALVEVYEVP